MLLGGMVYFLSPQPTGAELWVMSPWIKELPQQPFESDEGSSGIIGVDAGGGVGALNPELGLTRWYSSRDFVSVSDYWLVNYDYSDNVAPFISLRTQDIYPNPMGEYPLVRDGWVFTLGSDLTSLRFGRDEFPLDLTEFRQWASVLTFVESNSTYVVAGLADGRLWVRSSDDAEAIIEPQDDWYTQGALTSRIPVGAAVFDTFGFVVYGTQDQRGLLWNLLTGELVLSSELPGRGTEGNSRISFYSPYTDVYSLFIERATGGIVHTISLTQGETRSQRVAWENVTSFDYLDDSGLGFVVHEIESGPKIEFFLPLDETRSLLGTSPFYGSVFSHNSTLFWIGNEQIGRFDLGWMYE